MEEVMKELEQGKEAANRLMNNLINPSSSSDSNNRLISKVLNSYENVVVMLSIDKDTRKRILEWNDQCHKKRKVSKKKESDKVKVCIRTKEEGPCFDDGYCWRKYGQKYIHGSKNPRGYYRCRHRFTQGCLAAKQVQKSDTNPLCYEIKYIESHSCNKGPKPYVKEQQQPKDTIKHIKSKEHMMLNVEDWDNKKEIFKTFSFSNLEDTPEIIPEWKNLSPTTTSESRITNNEMFSASVSSAADNDDDSCFSSLENILVLTNDLSWMN